MISSTLSSREALKVAAIQVSFYLGSGARKVGQADCILMQDGGREVFVMPDVPAKADACQFVMAVEIGEGGVCMTMWSAVQPIKEGRLFLEGLRK